MAHGTLLAPRRLYFCPRCLEDFSIGDCDIQRTVKDPSGHDTNKIEPARRGLFRNVWVPALDGPENLRQNARRICPGCKNPLPHNYEQMDNHIIAVLGDAAAGKTHYITSLIAQLQSRALTQVLGPDARLAPLNQDTSTRYAGLYTRLFTNRSQLDKNMEGEESEPLLWILHLGNGKRVTLFLYDRAGEDVRSDEARLRLCQFIFHARALIWLVDPLKSPAICGKLRSETLDTASRAPAAAQPADTLVDWIMRDYCRFHGLPPYTKLQIPTAVCYAKSDYLRYVIESPEYSHLGEPTADYSDGLHMSTLEAIHSEVEALMGVYDPQLLAACRTWFDRRYFGAVSATDCAPNETGKFDRVTPFRCLDPLMWLLAQSDLITLKR